MILTTKGKYAVMAVADICLQQDNKPISLAVIAERNNLSLSYLEQIFCSLKKQKIVKSIKGPGGGYVLARDKNKINVADIIKAIGEPIKMTNCGGKKNCSKDSTECRMHHLWSGLEKKIYNYLDSINLVDLCR